MALSPKELEVKVRWVLAQATDDLSLRRQMELLSQERAFNGFTYLWGPVLYRRNRVMHRSFILAHFSNWQWKDSLLFPGHFIAWSGEVGKELDAWLVEADRVNDIQIFRRLYRWKDESLFKKSRRMADLSLRFRKAKDRSERNTIIEKYDDGWSINLDEPTALDLYAIDSVAAKPFILKHLSPNRWDSSDKRTWDRLSSAARDDHDDEFHFSIYRKTVSLSQWQKDILQLARTISDPGTLAKELEVRHPEWRYERDLGPGLSALIKARGAEVLGYAQSHVADLRRGWFRGSFGTLIDLALKNGWLDFWSALLRICGDQKEFVRAVDNLLDSTALSQHQIEQRLVLLAGPSREFNAGPFGFARVHLLDDRTAVKMYKRLPALLRGPFKLHISLTWGHAYRELTEAAIAANDEAIIDFLASRAITREYSYWSKDVVTTAKRLSTYFENLIPHADEFSRRATSVLSQVPAYSIWRYDRLIAENQLARLLFERTATVHLDGNTVRDLLEAPEIHVQLLAFRALGLDDDRARKLAVENAGMLIATLLRPLHRKSRYMTFGALLNAASTLESARRVVVRARQALDLPDQKYPKEKLLGLIANILRRWPELRGPREMPLVFGEAS